VGKVVTIDSGRVAFAFKRAPGVFAEEVDYWLNKERMKFLGSQKNSSYTFGIKGKLRHKETAAGQAGWPENVVRNLSSYKEGKNTLSVKMVMGLLKSDSRLQTALDFLEKGGVVNSGKYMPVPNLEALKYYGVHNQFQAQEFFKTTFGKNQFQLVPGKNGNYHLLAWSGDVRAKYLVRYGRPDGVSAGNDRALLLFTLSKKAKIKKQFDFSKTWARRVPAVMNRGEAAIYRATRKVERLMEEGKII
jgi:hypothetical protein